MPHPRDRSVFVNCPFDDDYWPLFHAISFTVEYCGYVVRSALEEEDGANVRLHKIVALLKASRFSIHDISRVELDPESRLPRFNMPLELGAAIGLRAAGVAALEDHQTLILDAERFRYQRFVSDLAGVDIRGHDNERDSIIRVTRNFLSSKQGEPIAGARAISALFALFEKTLPALAAANRQEVEDLTFHDRMIHQRLFLDLHR